MAIGADRTGKPPLRCLFLLQSSPTLLPGQWDCHQSCKYTLGATFVIISQNFLIARHNIKHVLWCAIEARVAFYSRPGLMYKVVNNIAPAMVSELFSFWNVNYNLKSGSQFHQPSANTVWNGQETISYLGPKIWNLVPE